MKQEHLVVAGGILVLAYVFRDNIGNFLQSLGGTKTKDLNVPDVATVYGGGGSNTSSGSTSPGIDTSGGNPSVVTGAGNQGPSMTSPTNPYPTSTAPTLENVLGQIAKVTNASPGTALGVQASSTVQKNFATVAAAAEQKGYTTTGGYSSITGEYVFPAQNSSTSSSVSGSSPSKSVPASMAPTIKTITVAGQSVKIATDPTTGKTRYVK